MSADDLDGATRRPPENAEIGDPGQFAALWNDLGPSARTSWLNVTRMDAEQATRCRVEQHAARLLQAERTHPDRERHHDTGRVCPCVTEHRPAPLELERHHVWPLGEGGPDIPANIAWVCPTTHTNAHELLRAMLRARRVVLASEFSEQYPQPVNRWAWRLAQAGYDAITTRTIHRP